MFFFFSLPTWCGRASGKWWYESFTIKTVVVAPGTLNRSLALREFIEIVRERSVSQTSAHVIVERISTPCHQIGPRALIGVRVSTIDPFSSPPPGTPHVAGYTSY
jgi:hypothetical protein